MLPPAIPSDREGFRRLFDELKDPMYRFLCRLSRDAHDAEDLLQETFTTLWRKREQFRGEGSLAGYVRRIAYRTFLNARTRLARRRAETPIGATGDAAASGVFGAEEPKSRERNPLESAGEGDERRLEFARVRAVVDELPEGWREPFVLHRYEGLTCAEVAEAMGLTPKAVELRLARAMKAVAARLVPADRDRSGPLPAHGA